ncbi:DUF4033 domain-containing protein [Cephalotus follicularis]|uniref:DUF4033 domain-containing protein n=1 Tax=Cephalotus follicularis TaxID=3775 RepID=A0A1Q3CG02_CEPFO|nr:DUF4033 domain-containing protein [Cephalotus follicularis]
MPQLPFLLLYTPCIFYNINISHHTKLQTESSLSTQTNMVASLFSQSRYPFTTQDRCRCIRKRKYSPIVAVVTRPKIPGETHKAYNVIAVDNPQKKSVFNDSWFDRLAIDYLSNGVQAVTGLCNKKSGYEGLVEATKAITQNFHPIQQRELVHQVLDQAVPKPILAMMRTLPQSKFAREHFASFTTQFFGWLVGPSEVRESEINGRREKNIVHIKKCRFLEEGNCIGMCINLCKMPSQTFIKESMGMPVNMVPNFEDMSCEMIFGQDPPASTDDPAFKQPCYKLCNAKQKHSIKCTN